MKSAVINKTSPIGDLLEMMSGSWIETDKEEWHIVRTPFFLVMTGTLDPGRHVLPFKFQVPVAARISNADGTAAAAIIKPGDEAVEVSKPCILDLQVFGQQADVKGA